MLISLEVAVVHQRLPHSIFEVVDSIPVASFVIQILLFRVRDIVLLPDNMLEKSRMIGVLRGEVHLSELVFLLSCLILFLVFEPVYFCHILLYGLFFI
jgi:hypothetical protein